LELCSGSGGWSFPTPKKARRMDLPKVQLYDLSIDIGERENVYDKFPDVVIRLTDLLQKYVDDGRSTPGKKQKNDVEVEIWKS
jgi:arylsulfatase A